MTENDSLQTEAHAYEIMQSKLGEQGMAMLGEQLETWHRLNQSELFSPLREALNRGDTHLPDGTLVHSVSMHETFDTEALESIAELGIVSGELIGKFEDAETHGCADFFRVPEGTDIASYTAWAKEPKLTGALKSQKGERLVLRGVTFIVDPNAEGMADLLQHDGYTDENMSSFVHPPSRRSSEDTAAILGGVPRGALAGAIMNERVAQVPENIEAMEQLFPGVPFFSLEGEKLHSH